MRIETDFDLSHYNTMRMSSSVNYFASCHNSSELLDIVSFATENKLQLKVIGDGSNLLFSEKIDGLIVKWAEADDCRVIAEDENYTFVSVCAGYNWHKWVTKSIAFGHGLENLAYIPGTVGAAPIQNIGAYGVEVGEFIAAIDGFQLSTRQFVRMDPTQCCFGYRDSTFKKQFRSDFIISRVIFKLRKVFEPVLTYGQLSDYDNSTANKLIDNIVTIRSEKLPDPAQVPNVGSYFKNPIVDVARYTELLDIYGDVPSFPVMNGKQIKLPAAWLIDQCGWKGKRVGTVGMHEKQALVMTGSSTNLKDVLTLEAQITDSVRDKFSINLAREPEILN